MKQWFALFFMALVTMAGAQTQLVADTIIIPRNIADSVNWNIVSSNRNNYDNIPVISLSESETESSANTQNVAGILSASRDVFLTNTAFQLSQGGFRYRGYSAENTAVLINGISMNNPDNGRVFWSEWGGLNDMFRGRQTSV